LTDVREHRAEIRWSPLREERGLFLVKELIQPAWPGLEGPLGEGWSLVCRFEQTPAEQGNPSTGLVHFLMDEAPHESLGAGSFLRLFDGFDEVHAVVRVLD